jgi:hypothetical protein
METPSRTTGDRDLSTAADAADFGGAAMTGRLGSQSDEEGASYTDLVKLRRREQRLRRLGSFGVRRARI